MSFRRAPLLRRNMPTAVITAQPAITGFIRQAKAGLPIRALRRQGGFRGTPAAGTHSG